MVDLSHSARAARVAVPALALLAACEMAAIEEDQPPEPPEPPARAAPERPAPEPSTRSAEVADYYAELERDRRAAGLLRTDGLYEPVDPETLVRNFTRIALREEHARIAGRITGQGGAVPLRRWEDPVRMSVEFGDSVRSDQRAEDLAIISDYAERLGDITGHPVSVTGEDGNFRVLVLGEEDRQDYGERLRTLIPGIDSQSVNLITGLPRSAQCVVATFARNNTDVYTDAVAVIRAELPDLTRESCVHEELAQGLGLPNDHDEVRPSIFNDREEYALLTRHDEKLLQILYDERLRPGMREDEVVPIVEEIAQELAGARS